MKYTVLTNEPMSAHTTFRTGGPAKEYYKIDSLEGLKEVLELLGDRKSEMLILGNGSNLLVSEKGIDVPVIDMRAATDKIEINGNVVKAGAGAVLSKVSSEAANAGLTGLEFAFGIPGTVGGAVFMNAGAYGGEIKNICRSVDVYMNGEVVTIPASEMEFDYRSSRAMREKMIVLSAEFVLEEGNVDEIKATIEDLTARRRSKQPLEYPSAGSTFKRPVGYFAGKLIMDSGLAGASVGGAMVSPKHCGFIINYDNATSDDIYGLIKKVQEVVNDKFGVSLEPEVKLVGDFE